MDLLKCYPSVNIQGLEIDGGYLEWQLTRMAYIINLFGLEYFKGKKILELGCYKGGISKLLHNLLSGTGSLTSVEGLIENYNYCKKTYPNQHFIHADLDYSDPNKWDFEGHYDIIVHWGLLYHLRYPIESIQSCLKHCDTLFLETTLLDCEVPFQTVPEKNIYGTDQSIHGLGSRPNLAFIENSFKHLEFKRYDDSKLNAENQPKYDTQQTNSGKEYRKFWIINTKFYT